MKKIGLISDSHGYIDEHVISHLVDVDEIWHAGDIGDLSVLSQLPKEKVLRIITGNIDDQEARNGYREELWFEVEGMKIGMIHIGGKPPQYAKGVKNLIRQHGVQLFVCGHSHICKVEFDKNLNCLYMNPGAMGQSGFHIVRTMLLFEIESGKIQNLRVVELGKRGRI
ncbi:metallophosphatase family protein [Aquiflexum sp. TKW24L]|uniref:metallophosphoesterase family protein n=1 Tax=Aquiflexum sp. TKW24L TaxID=2942212 RepID=UPI0020BDB5A4|nr:metallophosphoesterase family protein [Aquiflexum sp. TKW24L]MCL6261025.1 metallophosphatase family protein [Aquiflexum sp. TKW24L]